MLENSGDKKVRVTYLKILIQTVVSEEFKLNGQHLLQDDTNLKAMKI